MSFKISPPVMPYRGTRGVDAYGAGGFHAPRDGGARKHEGLDFVTVPGDKIIMPAGGLITGIGTAYPYSTLGAVHIACSDGIHFIRLFYLNTGREVGTMLGQGDILGSAEDVAAYWELKSPRAGTMTNHVHLELSAGGFIGHGGMPLDPALHLEDIS